MYAARQMTATSCRMSGPVSARAGIGLKPEFYASLLRTKPSLPFLEVHAENYMGEGGAPHRYLEAIAEDYPLSFHGVAMSLGGHDRLDGDHLKRWKALVERYQPAFVSEHVAWASFGGAVFHDLLPLPYTEEALDALCRNIDEMQEALGRRILIENPSAYMAMRHSPISEPEFLEAAAQRTGCGLLMDVNNIYVSARNLALDPNVWVDAMPADVIEEIHLAGHTLEKVDGVPLRIDDHGSRVCDDVWTLYRRLIARIGPRPTLIEWDTDVPPMETLLEEAAKADRQVETLLLEEARRVLVG
jgi:uncharacterized protein (UPF0276 family)